MALTADFYNFSKRQNSTKVPTGIVGTSFNITLKQPTSLNSPVFLLNTDTFTYNYCSFNGAYYFVTDVVSVRNDIWEVHCTKDVLATYKTEILSSNAYILYDESANTDIVDQRMAIKATPTVNGTSTEIPQMSVVGKFLLTVLGESGTDTWVIPSTTNLTNLIYTTWENTYVPQVPVTQPSVMEQLQKSTEWITKLIGQLLSSGKAPENVRACKWIPWDISGDDNGTIYLGQYDTGVNASKVQNRLVTYTYSVSIPWQVNDWRRTAPFSQVYLYLPFIGLVHIPSGSISHIASLSVEYVISKLTGDLSVMVYAGSNIIGVYSGSSATDLPIGSSNITNQARTTGLIQAGVGIGAAVLGGGAGIGTASLIGIMSGMQNMMIGQPSCISSASGGTDAGLPQNIKCFVVTHDTNVLPSSIAQTIGTPTFSQKSLSSISGYVQTQDFSLQAAAPDQDLQRVNTYLNGGAFIE